MKPCVNSKFMFIIVSIKVRFTSIIALCLASLQLTLLIATKDRTLETGK